MNNATYTTHTVSWGFSLYHLMFLKACREQLKNSERKTESRCS